MNTKEVLIFGSGGHGKVVLDILLESGADVLGFLDEDKNKIGSKVRGFKVLGGFSYLKKNKSAGIVLGIGNNKIRERIYNFSRKLGISIVSAVHPKAIVSKDTKIGEGVVIMPGAVVNPGTVLRAGVVVNTGATIDHDCCLERFSQIWPGAHLAGGVVIGALSYVGTGASVIQNITVGNGVVIGSGAAVIADIPDGVTAVGVPARIIKGKQ